jgi:hypothetical protein
VNVSVHVWATEADAPNATLSLSTSPKVATSKCGSSCDLGDVKVTDGGKFITATLTIPKSMTSGSVILTTNASGGGGASAARDKKTIIVTKRPASTTPSTPSTGGSTGTGTAGGTTGVGGVGAPAQTPLNDTGFVPASPAGVLQSPQVALPQIAPQAPVTAPTVAAAAPNTLRSGGIPAPQELTFQRLASTQAAWLAALLVAFSLLMTQLRLVRPYGNRWRGDHRRPRHGLFQR